jgi:hypothetical protein
MLPGFVRYHKKTPSVSPQHITDDNDGEITVDKSYQDLVEIPSFEFFHKTNRLVQLNVSHNKIREIRMFPDTLRVLNIEYNEMENIGSLPTSLTNLICCYNRLTSLGDMSRLKCLTVLSCQSNQLRELSLPENIYFVNVRFNRLENMDSFPDSIRYLNVSNNQIKTIEKIPKHLEDFNCGDNQIAEFLPTLFTETQNLKRLNCKGNQLENIEYLPDSLNYLYCVCNRLTHIYLPNEIEYLYANDNQLTELPYLPDSLKMLFLYNNPTMYPFTDCTAEKIRQYIREHEPLYILK